MAANLAAAGTRVIGYIRRPELGQELEVLSVKPTTDIADLFDCEFVITMLPDDAVVREVVFGRSDKKAEGLIAGLMPGSTHLSMSTITTAAAAVTVEQILVGVNEKAGLPLGVQRAQSQKAAEADRPGLLPIVSLQILQ